MDKQQFRIDKNEKLLTLLQERKGSIATVINEGDTIIQEDKTIMGKPIVVDAVPRDGQLLSYNAENKEWEATDMVNGGSGGDILLATTYSVSAAGGILICSQYNVGA